MSKSPKKNEEGSVGDGTVHQRKNLHESGSELPRTLVERIDRIVNLVDLRSRGEFLILSLTIVLDMCESKSKRYLPELVLLYDKNRPTTEAPSPKPATKSRIHRFGTHFSGTLEERIATVIKPIGWSRNQFIMEAAKTMVQWCEEPSTRTIPAVVSLYETAQARGVPLKIKRTPGRS